MLRRIRYAAAVVALSAFGLLLGAYAIAYITREQAGPPDGPLLVVVLTALLIFLGLKVPDVDLGTLLGRTSTMQPPAPKDDDDER